MTSKLRAAYNLLSPGKNLQRLKRGFGKADLPRWFTFVMTYWCNSRCLNCNIWQLKPKNELKIEELERLIEQPVMRKLKCVNLTGGEPFLRKDIAELIEMFESHGVKTYGLTTNAIIPKLTIDRVKEILKFKKSFGVGVSIDGIGEVHDKLRGVKGNYDSAIETIKGLQKLEGVYPKISFTWSSSNINEFGKVRKLAEELDVGFSYRIAQAGQYFGNEGFVSGIDSDDMLEIEKEISEQLKNTQGTQRIFTERMIDHENKPRQIVKCFSGFQSFMLDSEGNVFPCITLGDKIGNIRDKSFEEIWDSEEFKKVRKETIGPGKCSCWNGCETPHSIEMDAGYNLGVLSGKY